MYVDELQEAFQKRFYIVIYLHLFIFSTYAALLHTWIETFFKFLAPYNWDSHRKEFYLLSLLSQITWLIIDYDLILFSIIILSINLYRHKGL
jgi:hypothetical protein